MTGLPVARAILDTSVILATDIGPLVMDLLIAATARAHDARVYTRNIADFRGLEGLVEVVAV